MVVRNVGMPLGDRFEAAGRLLAFAADSRSVVFEILAEPMALGAIAAGCECGGRDGGRAADSDRAQGVAGERVRMAGGVDVDARPSVLAAPSSFRSREAARELFAATDESLPSGVRAAGFAGLSRLAGRDDSAANRAEWGVWDSRGGA